MREYRTALMDNRRWAEFKPRPDDIFICTPAKCGTTWTQTIVANLLFVHYADLKSDLGAEMRRIAKFLGIEVPEALWDDVVDRCTFESMRENGEKVGPFDMMFEGGAKGFLFKGTNGRWRDVLTSDQVAAYEKRARECLLTEAVQWLEQGRHPG
jgi:aryl sulfotransferase